MNDPDVLRRAALAVLHRTDHEARFYEAQSPVEDWALDALEAAVLGEAATAQTLLDAMNTPIGKTAAPTQSRNGTKDAGHLPALRTSPDRRRTSPLLRAVRLRAAGERHPARYAASL